ncbi:metal-dependent hydrolase [Ferrovum myxofaciens]|uniref:Metal-dependent hydrolase n=1 Tax=Ferrovum myxofaciens TaxID=416213 RepID=A0A9E6MWU7_9PROT|nr:metal-dependent hydrolase [Ferrovum myxofaciens]QKE37321.2 MAG: metal-dependent hydrolase [Ferrovum myxofaciens]QWY74967.1 MAG: metal-dependent hydrolase [Ferrovum myxofaciens]QWY77714.1 MAG: metal-dependent hydrolase [Ferrovum myxofaciens]
MLAKTHVIFGAGSALVGSAVIHLPLSSSLLMVSAGVIGSLLPDIDHPGSTFGRKIWPVSLIISKVFGHRGITHSLLAVAGLAFLLVSNHQLPTVGIGLIVGYLSHLLGDFITPHGIPLFWPARKCYHISRPIKTGGFGENVLATVVLIAGVFLAWNSTFV